MQPSSESDSKQEEDHPKKDSGYSSILPSMPSQQSGARDLPSPAPEDQMPDYVQPPSFVQPQAAFPPIGQGGIGAEGVIPSSSPPLGHPPFPAGTPGTGAYSPLLPQPQIDSGTGGYSPLPPPLESTATGVTPVHHYPGYGPYQPPYGFGSAGQGYPYGASSSMPYSSLGSAGSQSGYNPSQITPGSTFQGMGPDSYGVGAQGYQYYGSGYPQQYQGQTGYGQYGQPRRGQGQGQGNRSFARNPGRPFTREGSRSGPDGANLFVFHIPNDMTNEDLHQLFHPHGTVLSANIMTERDTGRGRGFGFVNFDTVESAARAIQHLNGYQIHGKRLKVQHKQVRSDGQGQDHRRGRSPSGYVPIQQSRYDAQQQGTREDQQRGGFVPLQHSTRPQSNPQQREVPQDRSPAGFKPLQEEGGPSETSDFTSTSVLPPMEALEALEDDDNQYTQGSRLSPSPLDDLNDMGTALPDHPK